ADAVRFLRGGNGVLREPAVALAAEGPALERPVVDGRAQHVPHENPFTDSFGRNPLPHINNTTADVRALDARELESGSRPRGISVVDGVETRRCTVPRPRGDGLRVPPHPGVHISVVNPGRGDLDQHLPR